MDKIRVVPHFERKRNDCGNNIPSSISFNFVIHYRCFYIKIEKKTNIIGDGRLFHPVDTIIIDRSVYLLIISKKTDEINENETSQV